jgi:hypothetical protein
MSYPILETIMANVQTRLEAIIGDADYFLGATLHSVQRYTHEGSAEDEQNKLAHLPTILIGRAWTDWNSSQSVGLWTMPAFFQVVIHLPVPVTDTHIYASWADVVKALFLQDHGLGTGMRDLKWKTDPLELESGQPQDGVMVSFSGEYQECIGAPGSGE